MPSLIKFKNITKGFKDKKVLKNINFKIKKGEIFGIIGMSGSGKTTLLNTLIGFLEPEKGDIYYYNKKAKKHESIFKNTLEKREIFGFATQVPSFYPRLTIEENLDHFGSLYNLPNKNRRKNIKKLLKMINLKSEKDLLAQTLSGGMEKRLGIACALVHDPEILILDEPTGNLDPVLREETWEIIKDINKSGTTVIVASHLLEELEPICNRIGILHNHALMEIGTPDQLKGRYSKNEEIRLTIAGKHKKIKKLMKKIKYVKKIKKDNQTLIFYTPQPLKTLYKLLNTVDKLKQEILQLEVSKPSLKEVFESIYNK